MLRNFPSSGLRPQAVQCSVLEPSLFVLSPRISFPALARASTKVTVVRRHPIGVISKRALEGGRKKSLLQREKAQPSNPVSTPTQNSYMVKCLPQLGNAVGLIPYATPGGGFSASLFWSARRRGCTGAQGIPVNLLKVAWRRRLSQCLTWVLCSLLSWSCSKHVFICAGIQFKRLGKYLWCPWCVCAVSDTKNTKNNQKNLFSN